MDFFFAKSVRSTRDHHPEEGRRDHVLTLVSTYDENLGDTRFAGRGAWSWGFDLEQLLTLGDLDPSFLFELLLYLLL